MRIFVGIPAWEILTKRIDKWREGFGNIGKVRWLKDENLHLTLVPPWYSDDIDGIVKVISGKVTFNAPFEIQFNRIEFGPAREKRLIWVRGEESENLSNLRIGLHDALGKNIEKRIFVPHLTVARFKREDFKNFKIKNLSESIEWSTKVGKFVLYESILSPKGAEYHVIKEFGVVES